MTMMRLASAAALSLLMLGSDAALASSDDAWEAFRKDVETACLKAGEGLFATNAEATVDPFGSESYGLALLTGAAKGAEDTAIMAICVYDKKSHAVEIGGELPAPNSDN